MMFGYEENWRILYIDDFYTTLKLSQSLYEKKIGCIGTIRKNRTYEQTEPVEPKNAGDV